MFFIGINIMVLIFFFLLLILLWVLWVFFNKKKKMRELNSMFECGFENNWMSRMSFSLRFFYMIILFLIFDMEIVLILNWPFFYYSKSMFFFMMCVFVWLIFMVTLEEWRRGVLKWSK